jgi:hypothetical protein
MDHGTRRVRMARVAMRPLVAAGRIGPAAGRGIAIRGAVDQADGRSGPAITPLRARASICDAP